MKKTNSQIWRFFSEDILTKKNIFLEADEFHLLSNVLRLNIGEEIELTNGRGTIAKATIDAFSKKNVQLIINEITYYEEDKKQLILCIGMPKPAAAEELLSWCCELGVSRINFFIADKTHIKNPLRSDRLKKIIRESLRISKSAWEPQITVYDSLQKLLGDMSLEKNNMFICDESSLTHKSLLQNLSLVNNNFPVRVFIGPEASFSLEEKNIILDNG